MNTDFTDAPVVAEGSDLISESLIQYKAIPSRGISKATCQKYKYGHAEYKGRKCHVAQFRDSAGIVVAQKLRFTDGAAPKFMWLGDKNGRSLFGLDTVRDGKAYSDRFKSKVVITEGELDALAVYEAMNSPFWPAVSVPDGATSAKKWCQKKLEELEAFGSITLCFDEDEPGRKAVKDILPLFSPGKAKVTRLPHKDACDVLAVTDGKSKLQDAIYGAKVHRPEGLVSGDEIWDAIENAKDVQGEPYMWGGLDDYLKGMRPKELILITAATGSGKSTISRTLCSHLLTTGHTVGYVALEESVAQSALGIYGVEIGWSRHLGGDLPVEKLREVHEKHGDRLHLFDHFGSTEADTLISKLRFLVKGLDCDVLFLDHISIAISGLDIEDERKALDKMMTDLRSLVEETGVTLFVISHLRRPKEGSHEEGKAVRIADLRGSQSLGQLPDIILAAERNQQSEDKKAQNTVQIRVLKNRPVGLLGICTALLYEPTTGLFEEVDLPKLDSPEEDFS